MEMETKTTYQVKRNGNGRSPSLADLPVKAVNLARRAVQLAGEQRGRHTIELLITKDGRWLIIVDDGRPEDLGDA